MEWKIYEQCIHQYLIRTYPGAIITYDACLVGEHSQVKRQIDILVEAEVAGVKLRLVFDCKFFNKKVDVKEVESFMGLIGDVCANQGILITNYGFSEAAWNRVMRSSPPVNLRVIDLPHLEEFKSNVAIPYVDDCGVILFTPETWPFLFYPMPGSLGFLHPKSISAKYAWITNRLIYINIVRVKIEKFKDYDSFLCYQDQEIKQKATESDIKYSTEYLAINFPDVVYPHKIRKIYAPKQRLLEYSVFVDFVDYVFYCVLRTTKRNEEIDLDILKFIIKQVSPIKISIQA